MHFDDRLATVLNLPVSGEAMARVQYVQLVDLLGTTPSEAHGGQLDSAFDRLAQLARSITADNRARLLRHSGLRLRSPRLLAMLAQDEPPVAAAAIAAADLQVDQWLDLIPALTVRSRGILRHRRDLGPRVEDRLSLLGVRDQGLPRGDSVAAAAANVVLPPSAPLPAATAIPLSATCAQEPAQSGESGIGAIVRRIEAYRRQHPVQHARSRPQDPRLPLGDVEATCPAIVDTFDFETDAHGCIRNADRDCAPMLFGMSLPALEGDADPRLTSSLSSLIRRRQPITARRVTIAAAPAISGAWHIDAVPLFETETGGFTGYAGRARRAQEAERASASPRDQGDLMRQVLHELRTPAGAIQMGAEVIQQQLYGPTPHEYRAIAASIASDTALVLAGFEELDRLVKLDAGAMRIEDGETDLAAALAATVAQIHLHTQPRESGFVLHSTPDALPVAIEKTELDRLIWRMLASLAGTARPAEMLNLRLDAENGLARLDMALPQSLAGLSDVELFQAHAQERSRTLSAGMFGMGFTLRLAAAEARAAGGSLVRDGACLRLTLPLAGLGSVKISTA